MTRIVAAGQRDTLYPNGFKINATDVRLGSGRIVSIAIDYDIAAPTVDARVAVYNGVDKSTGRPIVGGTTTTGVYRIIGGTAITLSDDGQPLQINAAPPAEVTAQQIIGSSAGETLEICCPVGMAVHIDNVANATQHARVTITYEPWVTGATRHSQLTKAGAGTPAV